MSDPVQTTAIAEAGPLPAALREPIQAGGQIAALVPQNIEQAFRLSQALAQSGDMIPETYRGNPQKIMAAVMKGMEVGLAPMQSLASIAVINGRPSIWGDAIPALVQRAGHHVDVELVGEGDAMTAVATLTRSDGRKIVRQFSVADAKLAKLWGKAGPWQNFPSRMLMMRARMFAARDGAADALMGLQMSEEVADYGPDKARDITPAAPRKGGVIYREDPPAQDPKPDTILEHDADGVIIDGPTPEQIAAAEEDALAARTVEPSE